MSDLFRLLSASSDPYCGHDCHPVTRKDCPQAWKDIKVKQRRKARRKLKDLDRQDELCYPSLTAAQLTMR